MSELDIFSHPDIHELLHAYDDDVATKLLRDMVAAEQLLREGASNDERLDIITELYEYWGNVIGAKATITGLLRYVIEETGETVLYPLDTASAGGPIESYFQGFTSIAHASINEGNPELYYLFSNVSKPNGNQNELYAVARASEAVLEFPSIMSEERLKAVTRDILGDIDEALYNTQEGSIHHVFDALRDVSFTLDLRDTEHTIVYSMLAMYLNDATQLSEAVGLKGSFSGKVYQRNNATGINVNSSAIITRPSFFFRIEDQKAPLLCLKGGFLSRTQKFASADSDTIIPLETITDVSFIER